MAKHEFGIIDTTPTTEDGFNCYEPAKYHCISVGDRYVEPLLKELRSMQCFWHSLNRKELGLAYCGITLIPPESLEIFISAAMGKKHLEELCVLLLKAQREKKFVIHFGI